MLYAGGNGLDNYRRKEKIDVLKKIAQKKYLIKELNQYIKVSYDELLSQEENIIFRKKVFDKIDSLTEKQKIGNEDYKKNREISINLLNNMKNNIDFKEKKARLLISNECVKVSVDEIFRNLNIVLEKTDFLNGRGDFILVDDGLNYGICILRTEYYYEFCMWGIE